MAGPETMSHQGPPPGRRAWSPLPLPALAALFADAPFCWWIAGGHALELATGRSWREHGDIDVLVLRRDTGAAREWLEAWDLWVADPPGALRPWPAAEVLPAPVHDIWCRRNTADDWRFQVMIDECDAAGWISRRDARIALPLEHYGATSPAGIPYLRPEVQLYSKAKAPRPKDEQDFGEVLPVLDSRARRWLAGAIATTFGATHPWLGRLA